MVFLSQTHKFYHFFVTEPKKTCWIFINKHVFLCVFWNSVWFLYFWCQITCFCVFGLKIVFFHDFVYWKCSFFVGLDESKNFIVFLLRFHVFYGFHFGFLLTMVISSACVFQNPSFFRFSFPTVHFLWLSRRYLSSFFVFSWFFLRKPTL